MKQNKQIELYLIEQQFLSEMPYVNNILQEITAKEMSFVISKN